MLRYSLIVVSSIAGGIAAHQTDHIIKSFEGDWQILSRYIVGTLTINLFFVLLLDRLNRAAVRDGLLASLISAVSVGLGVSLGRLLDSFLAERRK